MNLGTHKVQNYINRHCPSICSQLGFCTFGSLLIFKNLNTFDEYLTQHSLKWEGTKYHIRQVRVPGTAPYWKACMSFYFTFLTLCNIIIILWWFNSWRVGNLLFIHLPLGIGGIKLYPCLCDSWHKIFVWFSTIKQK